MIVLATMHDDKFKELAEATWENNKVKYAEKHGYAYLAKTDEFYGFEPGFEKIQFMIDIFDTYPDTESIWWTGTDSMVTNFNIKVEDKVKEVPEAHIIMSSDFNFMINCDSMLVKNTPEAKAWLQDIMDHMEKYFRHQFREQQYMIDSADKYVDIIEIMPQHFMNSYEYKLYRVMPWQYEEDTDVNGERGQWEPGDWLVHWPGTQPRERTALVQETLEKIIY